MRQNRRNLGRFSTLAMALLAAGCGGPRPDEDAGSKGPLLVAAASDLQKAGDEIGERFHQATGIRVAFRFGPSGQLAQQIRNGSPDDVFLSANMDYVKKLADGGFVRPDSVASYAKGELVLVVREGSAGTVGRLADLAKPEVKAVALANPEYAPYGLAAKQALERAGLWDAIASKRAVAETVRQAMQYVETGNAEAGLVSRSIAGAERIRVLAVDPALYDPIIQGLGIISETPRAEAAEQFARFLSGDEGRAVLASYGFAPAEGAEGR